MTINADGSRIVTTTGTGVKVWSVRSVSPEPTAVTIDLTGDYLLATAIDPSGERIVVVGQAGATLWSADGRRLATLPAEGLEGAEFSGDGSRLVGFGSSGVHVWQVSSAEMRADLDRRLGGNTYSDQECAVYRIEPCPAG